MKKILLLLPLFLLVLVGCKVEINADMYFLGSNWPSARDDDFEILDNYSKYLSKKESFKEYEENNNKELLKSYEENFFDNHCLIIIYLNDPTSGNEYALKETSKANSKLIIKVEIIKYGLGQAFSTTAYCVEVETKGIKKVEVKRITNL